MFLCLCYYSKLYFKIYIYDRNCSLVIETVTVIWSWKYCQRVCLWLLFTLLTMLEFETLILKLMSPYDHLEIVLLQEFWCYFSTVKVWNSSNRVLLPFNLIAITWITPHQVAHDPGFWNFDVSLNSLQFICFIKTITQSPKIRRNSSMHTKIIIIDNRS